MGLEKSSCEFFLRVKRVKKCATRLGQSHFEVKDGSFLHSLRENETFRSSFSPTAHCSQISILMNLSRKNELSNFVNFLAFFDSIDSNALHTVLIMQINVPSGTQSDK